VSRIFEEFQHPATQPKYIVQHFGGFFIQYCKSAPANWKKGFYTNRDPNKKEVGFILYEAAQNFEAFSNIQVKLKNRKAVDVLFKAYPMVPLSCRSNSMLFASHA
jgi:hypothetical protein